MLSLRTMLFPFYVNFCVQQQQHDERKSREKGRPYPLLLMHFVWLARGASSSASKHVNGDRHRRRRELIKIYDARLSQ